VRRSSPQVSERFYGTIILPMQDVRLACEELERMAKHRGMRAVFIAERRFPA
jgi:hypothetical protein